MCVCECSIVAFLSPTTTRPKAQPNPKPTPFRKSGPNEFVPRTDNRPATMDLLFFLLGECPNGSTSLNEGLNRCSPPHVMGGACAPKPPGTYRFLERNRRKRPPFEISHRPGRRNPFIVNATAPINSTPPPPLSVRAGLRRPPFAQIWFVGRTSPCPTPSQSRQARNRILLLPRVVLLLGIAVEVSSSSY